MLPATRYPLPATRYPPLASASGLVRIYAVLSSALLLVLEITTGRLLAPHVGVTLYSWTSIIGVILAGLSLGNWLGGPGPVTAHGKAPVSTCASWTPMIKHRLAAHARRSSITCCTA